MAASAPMTGTGSDHGSLHATPAAHPGGNKNKTGMYFFHDRLVAVMI
jgi:hypothetical protein